MLRSSVSPRSGGFTLIEVLVTLLIIAIGLLGLAGLQITSLKNQMETYQRAQALLLVEDMVNRIRVNAIAARSLTAYPNETTYGQLDSDEIDAICPDPSSATIAQNDRCQWNDLLAGSDVTLGTDSQGSVMGALGCIDIVDANSYEEVVIRVTVAWQGSVATKKPQSDCGANQYGSDDSFRRAVSMDVVLADLSL
ncbi:MAG: type IV pilus modification protein PilV [Halioglobus sp.]